MPAIPVTCSIEGCGKSVKGRGWCAMHWRRWRKHGDPHFTLRPDYGHTERITAQGYRATPWQQVQVGYRIYLATGSKFGPRAWGCWKVAGLW
jgi:hypothetical protein